MQEDQLVLGIDIGGTKTALGVVTRDGRLLEEMVLPSEAARGKDVLMKRIVSAAGELITGQQFGKRIAAIGVGFPGPISPATCKVAEAPNLPGWEGVSLCEVLSGALSIPTYGDNDANAAALGEWLYGSGRGTRDFIYLTISTGIGCGIISGGRLIQGTSGYSGEVGHMIMDPLGPECGCGRRGCLETLASGTAIGRQARTRLSKGEESVLSELGRPVEDITAREVFEGAAQEDPLCQDILDEAMGWIAIGCNNLLVTLNPSRIALGGGVGLGGNWFLEDIEQRLRELSPKEHFGIELVQASLGKNAGIVGAGAVAWLRIDPMLSSEAP